jgi:hypothetical protein
MARPIRHAGGRPRVSTVASCAAILLVGGSACDAGASLTPAASPPTPVASPLVFDSKMYPYRLSLPAGVAHGSWTPATRHWQADMPIFRGSSSNDEASTVEGRLFIVGAPWSRTLREFETRVRTMMAQDHDCKSPVVRKEITVGSDRAIGFTQTCSTTDLVFTRVVVAHSGYGLVVSLGAVNAAKTAGILEVLSNWLRGLTWTGA